jgi:hypothetical protein
MNKDRVHRIAQMIIDKDINSASPTNGAISGSWNLMVYGSKGHITTSDSYDLACFIKEAARYITEERSSETT